MPTKVKLEPAAPDVLHVPVNDPLDVVAVAVPITVPNGVPVVYGHVGAQLIAAPVIDGTLLITVIVTLFVTVIALAGTREIIVAQMLAYIIRKRFISLWPGRYHGVGDAWP